MLAEYLFSTLNLRDFCCFYSGQYDPDFMFQTQSFYDNFCCFLKTL